MSNQNFRPKVNKYVYVAPEILNNLTFGLEMDLLQNIKFLLILLLLSACKSDNKEAEITFTAEGIEIPVDYASGFSLTDFGDFKLVVVKDPWPDAGRSFTYVLAEKGAEIPSSLKYDQKITIPVKNMVVTSTTHVASLEILEEEETLTGFPGLDYISSQRTRQNIAEGKIRELGQNEILNTEVLLDLQPDVVIGFSIDGGNKSLNMVQKSGIPVVLNGDWTETSPLGKAEWIKFFGAFYNKIDEASSFFEDVEQDYLEAKTLAGLAKNRPTVLSGAMYKDQWYLPAGESWQARFIRDAHADYLFSNTGGSGSLSLSMENVLAEAQDADFWVGPAQFHSYNELQQASPHYQKFSAFQERNVFTFSSEKGETGGVIFYELGPVRPDLVLKDLVSIFHPYLLPDHQTTFYKPLE